MRSSETARVFSCPYSFPLLRPRRTKLRNTVRVQNGQSLGIAATAGPRFTGFSNH